jgi:hypothetical protein
MSCNIQFKDIKDLKKGFHYPRRKHHPLEIQINSVSYLYHEDASYYGFWFCVVYLSKFQQTYSQTRTLLSINWLLDY